MRTSRPCSSIPSKSGPARGGPKWETSARDRVRAGIRRFTKPLTELVERDANEGTKLILTRARSYAH
jgi:hypothetical protein